MRQTYFLTMALVCVALGLTGCVQRKLLTFSAHKTKDAMLLETLDTTDFWLAREQRLVSWSCAEQGESLRCVRQCGGSTDLTCPAAQILR